MVQRKAQKVEIDGCAGAPLIEGCNFFSGEDEFAGGDESSIRISGGIDKRQWEFFWRRHAGTEPPGRLPEGALAVLMASRGITDPTTMELESLRLDNDETHISWKCTHTALPGDMVGRMSYAILVVPGKELKESFSEVYCAEEQRKTAEALKVFTEGSREHIKVRPAMKFRLTK